MSGCALARNDHVDLAQNDPWLKAKAVSGTPCRCAIYQMCQKKTDSVSPPLNNMFSPNINAQLLKKKIHCNPNPPNPCCTGLLWFPLLVVSPQEGRPIIFFQAVPGWASWVKAQPPGACRQAPPPSLDPEQGHSVPVPGEVLVSLFFFSCFSSGHAGGIMFFGCPGNTLASLWRSWTRWLGKGRFGYHFWDCCPCDPELDKW